MRTIDVKVGKEYMYKNSRVTIIKRIPGIETKKRNMHSGILFIGMERTRKSFEISNGEVVYADKLTPISN